MQLRREVLIHLLTIAGADADPTIPEDKVLSSLCLHELEKLAFKYEIEVLVR